MDPTGTLFQVVRLVDVFLLGPAMIRCARGQPTTETERSFLLVSGFATIVFNGVVFLTLASRK